MRLFLTFLFGIFCALQAISQDSLNMTRLARWDDDSLPIASPNNLKVQYSGCWGLAVNGHEFAIVGGARHVLVFDITSPSQPELIGKFEGTTNTVWREFKSYKNRIYGVSDGTTEGMMILDFNNAPDTIIQTYFSNALFNNAHTITLDTSIGRIYLNGTNVANQGLLVLDISQDPDNPVVLSNKPLPGGYIHDSYTRDGIVYASCGYGGFYVYDYNDTDNPLTLASLPPSGTYHHNNWLSVDGKYAYATEEIPSGRPIQIIDLQDLANGELTVANSFLDPLLPAGTYNAIPHNVYIKDHLLFDSQYEDGLLVYDISVPLAPVLVGYYDTHPENTVYNTYYGCWGNYPWLPSGTIIASDMQNGLQLLRLTNTTGIETPGDELQFQIYPNPATDWLRLSRSGTPGAGRIRIHTLTGQTILEEYWPEGTTTLELNVAGLVPGIYFAELRLQQGTVHLEKVLIK